VLLVGFVGACAPIVRTGDPQQQPPPGPMMIDWRHPEAGAPPLPFFGPDGGALVDAHLPFFGPDGGGPPPPPPPPPEISWVFANSADALYRIDPETLQVQPIGPFSFGGLGGSDQITDIALDRTGNMIAISYTRVYAVDKTTAACRFLANLDRQFNGLSFLPSGTGAGAPEILVASALDGSLYQIDPSGGASRPIGSYGNGTMSSGDLVSVIGFGTVATVRRPETENDWLARIDPATGLASPVGTQDTGFRDIWGLGFWRGRVYGFTAENQFVLIDPTTGIGQGVQVSGVSWWGAGVTTSAPIAQ
jgi:hypothetical protein